MNPTECDCVPAVAQVRRLVSRVRSVRLFVVSGVRCVRTIHARTVHCARAGRGLFAGQGSG
eukprot:7837132-Alexandrium_andersonii.AAC.1